MIFTVKTFTLREVGDDIQGRSVLLAVVSVHEEFHTKNFWEEDPSWTF